MQEYVELILPSTLISLKTFLFKVGIYKLQTKNVSIHFVYLFFLSYMICIRRGLRNYL